MKVTTYLSNKLENKSKSLAETLAELNYLLYSSWLLFRGLDITRSTLMPFCETWLRTQANMISQMSFLGGQNLILVLKRNVLSPTLCFLYQRWCIRWSWEWSLRIRAFSRSPVCSWPIELNSIWNPRWKTTQESTMTAVSAENVGKTNLPHLCSCFLCLSSFGKRSTQTFLPDYLRVLDTTLSRWTSITWPRYVIFLYCWRY